MDSKASRKNLGLMGATLLRRGSHPVLHAASLFAALLAVVVLFAGVERVLLGWACAEALFAVYQLRRYRVLNAEPVEGAAVDPERVALLQERLLQLKGVMSIEKFFSGWFLGAPFESLKRGNIEDFIAYGFYCQRPDDLAPEVRRQLSEYITKIEAVWGVQFEEGRTQGLRFMAHLWEHLRYVWKPLAVRPGCKVHLATEAMGLLTAGMLLALGFRLHREQGFTYWLRAPRARRAAAASLSSVESSASAPAASSAPSAASASPLSASPAGSPVPSCSASPAPGSRRVSEGAAGGLSLKEAVLAGAGLAAAEAAPVVFVHGVGLGLTPYLHFIAELLRTLPGRPLVLLEVRAVSVSLTRRAVNADAVASAAAGILARHGWQSAAFVGHSYGTFVLSRLAQTRAALVQSMTLIDPVSMLTIYPQLLHNFVYRTFHPANGLIDSLRYAFSRDLVIAAVFGRKFVWHQVCLWPEELPPASLVVLSAGDDLVPSSLILAQLKQHSSLCQVLVHPTAAHGGFLLDSKFRRQMLHAMQRTLAAGATLSAKQV